MIARLIRLAAALCLLGAATWAQTAPDYDDWRDLASEAEALLDDPDAAIDTLEVVRAEIAKRRSGFLTAQSVNAARIDVVQSQLDVLGAPPPEGETEDPATAERRETLREELARLREPVLRAEEAYTQANALVAALDTRVRDRFAARLLERQSTPLNPANWPGAITIPIDAARSVAAEVSDNLTDPDRREGALSAAPLALVLALIGIVLILRSRWWVFLFSGWAVARSPRGQGVLDFVLSLGQIALPLLGVYLFSLALDLSNVFGPTGQVFISALPIIAMPIILSVWLLGRLFPATADRAGPMRLELSTQVALRRWGFALAVVVTLSILARTIEEAYGYDGVAIATLKFPLQLLLALFLWRLGTRLTGIGAQEEDQPPIDVQGLRGAFLRILGRLAVGAAVIGAALAAIGYAEAARVLLVPAALTLALSGVIVVLQKLVADIYALVTGTDEGRTDALAPVLIGFLLTLASLPVYALIWGARVTDLTELWSRVRAGIAIGETRISPVDFLTFGLVFIAVLVLTRFIQAALRNTVLPRTRIDVGGRNAIVSGLGYVGAFLAIILAVTSAGIDLSSIALVAGALSVGIGFGLQNVVSNFVSGIILLIERPISEGDWIEVGGKMGYVRDISVRSTRIETFDRTDVIVPNADLVSNQVINWTRGNLVGRVIVPVGVAYGTDTKRVEKILAEIAADHPLVVLNPKPTILFRSFGASSLDFEIRAILRDVNWVLTVQSDLNHAIAVRFAKEGIEIPFPQQDVWLRQSGTSACEAATPLLEAERRSA